MRRSCVTLVVLSSVIFVLSSFVVDSAQAGFQVGAYDFKIETKVMNEVVVEYTPGLIVLTTQPGVSLKELDNLISRFEGEIIDSWQPKDIDEINMLLKIPSKTDAFEVAGRLASSSIVRYAHVNTVERPCAPNDPYYVNGNQWALNQASDHDIDMPEGWNITQGSSSIKIAILDSGIPMSGSSLTHLDLDNTSHIVLVSGADLRRGDDYPDDEYKHGTAVSGVAGAETNNGEGIAGVGWNCKLMPLKVAISSSSPYYFKRGVYKAVENGAKVVNYSYGGTSGHQDHRDAIVYAQNNGCVIVAASGNDGGSVLYPAKYSSSYSNVVAVGATNDSDQRPSWSNHGSELNVVAPGVMIKTTDLPGSPGYSSRDYCVVSGTSLAAPHVAGLAGLVFSKDAGLTTSQVRDIIQYSAEDKGSSGWDEYYGWGRINAWNALRITTAGNLPDNEVWRGTVSLTGNVTVPSGVKLTTLSGATINLNGYYVKSTGGTIIDNGATWDPDIAVKQGSTLKGHYSTILAATNAASSGQTVRVASGTYTESNNLTVNPGVNLIFDPGVTLKMASGKKLTVNGSLAAYGTSSQPITFRSSSGTWYGIEVYNTCNLYHSTIKNAQYGVYAYDTSVHIFDCTFTSNTTALQFENYAGGDVQLTTFEDFNTYGIKCKQNSAPVIRPYNIFFDNYYGVWGDNTSRPALGDYVGQGYNSIQNLLWDVYSTYPYSIYAQYNWWGDPDPSPGVTDNVVWEPYLDYDPTGGRGRLAKLGNSPFTAAKGQANVGSPASSVSDPTGSDEFEQAYRAYLSGDYERALELFKDLVMKYPDHFAGRQALAFVHHCLRKLNRGAEALPYLSQVVAEQGNREIAGLARSIVVGYLVRAGEYEEAITMALNVIKGFPASDLVKYALYDLGRISWYLLGDHKTGERYYRQLIAQYPGDDLSLSALATLGEWMPELQPEPQPNPPQFALSQNSPNPFNASTMLRIVLNESGKVRLSIYNVVGQEVAVLAEGVMHAGPHTVLWDGRDAQGVAVGSGLYFARLEAEGVVHTRKLLLIR